VQALVLQAPQPKGPEKAKMKPTNDFDKVIDDWIQTQPDARKASRVGKLIKSAPRSNNSQVRGEQYE